MARNRPGAEPPGGGAEQEWPKLSSRHRKTLETVFKKPPKPDIPWRDIEALFVALGGRVTPAKGSRRTIDLGERTAVFHEPHPERVTDKGAVADVREFLRSAGVEP